jgi:hypothetical protein
VLGAALAADASVGSRLRHIADTVRHLPSCLRLAQGAESRRMNRTDVMLAVVNMAAVGGAMPSNEAISHIATMVDRLNPASASYQEDVGVLLRIGATIWTLEYEASRRT